MLMKVVTRVVLVLQLSFACFVVEGAESYTFPHRKCFQEAAQETGLSPSLLAAIATIESGLDSNAVSSSEAVGLMQIKWPLTAKALGITERELLFDPCRNVSLGATYVSRLEKRFDSRLVALAAYYLGPTDVQARDSVDISGLLYAEKVLEEEKRIIRASIFQAPDSCDTSTFMQIGISTHRPPERRDLAIEWLNEHRSYCSVAELVFLGNSVPASFGVADANGEISRLVRRELEGREKNKGRGN